MHYILLLILILIPSIGYCHDPIYTNNYDSATKLAEKIDHKILLIFSADWCKNCVNLKSAIESHPQDLNNIIICIIDIDQNTDLVKKFKVKKFPTSFLIKNQIISGYQGYDNYDKYISWYKEGYKK